MPVARPAPSMLHVDVEAGEAARRRPRATACFERRADVAVGVRPTTAVVHSGRPIDLRAVHAAGDQRGRVDVQHVAVARRAAR